MIFSMRKMSYPSSTPGSTGIEPAPIRIEDNFMKRRMLGAEQKPIMI